MYDDIPLNKATILWNSDRGKWLLHTPVCVEQHPVQHREGKAYAYSDGACSSDWSGWEDCYSDSDRLLGLLGIGMKLVVDHDIPMETVHKAFMNIPEYRHSLKSLAFVNHAGSMAAVVDDYFEDELG